MTKDNKGREEKLIMNELLELGIPSHLRGFTYLTFIIKYIIDYKLLDIKLEKEIYKTVAKEYLTSSLSVERDIRYSIEIGYLRTKSFVNDDLYRNSIDYDKVKPTNKQFIMTVANKIKLDYF